MSSLLKLPHELLPEIASELETKRLHGLVLTNHFLYRLLQHTLYASPSKEALMNVIDPGNTAVFQKFLERGLDVNLVASTSYWDPIPLFAYVAFTAHPAAVVMALLLFETEEVDTTGWRIFPFCSRCGKTMTELLERYGLPVETAAGQYTRLGYVRCR
jgi:hypothetical protein